MNGVQVKKVAKYVLLPEIFPRIRKLFTSGFGYIAFLMASIYGMVRLLPPNHPYLDPRNVGHFGIHHVIVEAANNLVISRKNIDQLVIFAAMLAAVVILVLQFVLLAYSIIVPQAMALSLFNTPNPTPAGPLSDLAFVLMDNVFGIPNIFCNNAGTCTTVAGGAYGAWPTGFHVAMQSMFRFYSMGLLLIAVLIFLYFVMVVVGETATTGHPFGQRFQNIWVPIRIVVALGLLIPVNFGMNSGQIITLYAAKAGSGFATNGWNTFNNTMTTTMGGAKANPSGEGQSLLAYPNPPDITPVLHFMSLVHACAFADWRLNEGVGNAGQIPPPPGSIQVRPYLVKKVMAPPADNRPREELLIGHDFAFARQFYDNSDIIIRFGRHNPSFTNENGNVEPTCGEIRVKVVDLGDATLPITQGGAYAMQVFYFNLIKSLWFTNLAPGSPEQGLVWLSQREAELHMSPDRGLRCMLGCVSYIGLPACSGPVPYPCEKQHPSALSRQIIIDDIQANQVNVAVNTAWQNFNNNNTGIVLIPEVRNYGWAGAGVWYNTINKVNGAFITAVYGMPAPTQYPKIMQEVKQKRSAQDSTITGPDQFCLNQSGGREIKLTNGDTAKQMAEVMCNVNKYWADSTANQGAKQESITKNAIEDVMHIILGTGGLFAMRDNNAAVHPMAQLAGVGKSLVDSAVLNIAVSTGFSLGGGLMGLVDKQGQKIGDIISRLGNGIAFMGLTAGFVLFYILPFLPFLYFLFAVGSWVKTIFEAMVGIPLWALAHLRIDGDGLPGDAAANGYFLIFEIFIRPILTVFGLIAAITIFTAQVRVLNFIWDLVVSNITGYDADPVVNVLNLATVPRGVVDQFFFTIIYTIIVYMLATASFKLIDKLPDNILRWMGAGVSSFGDINEDPTQSLTRYAALGGMTIGKQATEGLQQFSGAVGKGIADEAQKGEKILGELSNMTNMLKKP